MPQDDWLTTLNVMADPLISTQPMQKAATMHDEHPGMQLKYLYEFFMSTFAGGE